MTGRTVAQQREHELKLMQRLGGVQSGPPKALSDADSKALEWLEIGDQVTEEDRPTGGQGQKQVHVPVDQRAAVESQPARHRTAYSADDFAVERPNNGALSSVEDVLRQQYPDQWGEP